MYQADGIVVKGGSCCERGALARTKRGSSQAAAAAAARGFTGGNRGAPHVAIAYRNTGEQQHMQRRHRCALFGAGGSVGCAIVLLQSCCCCKSLWSTVAEESKDAD